MAIEIERKFLVAHDGWRRHSVRKSHLRDGLISCSSERKVRVRIRDDRATLTIKAKKGGIRDVEFEYEIPREDAEELLAAHCGKHVLCKTRHCVPCDGFVWDVDVYEGILDGVVLAEVASEDVQVPLPDWIGPEVTGQPEYKKINMQEARLQGRGLPPMR